MPFDSNALWNWLAPMLLAVVRCYGLMWTAPLLSSRLLSARLRTGLALLLGISGCVAIAPSAPHLATDWSALAWHLPLEFTLGAALGYGVRLLLTAVELAAALIDQQAGLFPAAAPHPDGSGETSASGTWLVLLAGTTWLTLAPWGGDLRLYGAWLDSLRAMPPGTLTDVTSPVRLLQDLAFTSIGLGLQIALPVIVTAGLLQGTWAIIARTSGGSTWLPPLAPARCVIGLLVLTLTATDIGARIAYEVDGVLHSAVGALASSTGTEPRVSDDATTSGVPRTSNSRPPLQHGEAGASAVSGWRQSAHP